MESEFHRELRRPHALGGNRVRIESARMYYAETIERAQKFSLKKRIKFERTQTLASAKKISLQKLEDSLSPSWKKEKRKFLAKKQQE